MRLTQKNPKPNKKQPKKIPNKLNPWGPCRETAAGPQVHPPIHTVLGLSIGTMQSTNKCKVLVSQSSSFRQDRKNWSNWRSGVSEGWGNSTVRRIWQAVYELARQHRTEIRLRNGNTLPWRGFFWTRSSFRHHLAPLPLLTSASLQRPLGLIFRLRN